MDKLDWVMAMILSVVVFIATGLGRTAGVYPFCILVFFYSLSQLSGGKTE